MKLLLVNPNRSQWITERMAKVGRAVLLPGEQLDAITSTDGPDVVKTPQQTMAAAAEVQALVQRYGDGYDAVIVGISLDCGLSAVRALRRPQPVVGMTEAACLAACTYGERFGVLTVGPAMQPLYARHVRDIGLEARSAGVEALDCPQAFSAAGDEALATALAVLEQGVMQLRDRGADSVVLAGAVLCGLGAQLSQRTRVQVWEGPACAVGLARMRVLHPSCRDA